MRSVRARRFARLVAGLIAASSITVVAGTSSAGAAAPCGPDGNAVACENSRPGSPRSEWDDFYGAGDDTIQGFAGEISVDVGDAVDFKIDTDAADYDITIYRLGYYDGDGARRIADVEPSATLPQQQPQCITDVQTNLYDCGNWGVSASWQVPPGAVSGVYIAHLNRTDTGGSSHITFIVRDDASQSDVVFQTSDPTWQAYNDYGGAGFYHGANGRAYKVSYNRPFATRTGSTGRDFLFANEYPMIRFLERNGYDVSYIAGVDTARSGGLLLNHDTYLSVGHDEYWSGAQRSNVEAARDAGVNLQFLSGNEMYWRTRYEPSADLSATPYRTLVSYKETWDETKSDPSSEWTGTWRDPRYAGPAQGAGRPENALTGTIYMSNFTDLPLTVSAAEGKLRLWRNTGLASMASASTQLAPHTVGYESDEDLDNGDRPPGLIRLSTTTGPTPEYLQDFGNNTAAGTTTHHLTMYRAGSGALVFGAGTVQWSWGLDQVHDAVGSEPAPVDPRMQQAQVNLLADMGAQPTTLQGGLVAAGPSADTTGPTVEIGTPVDDSQVDHDSTMTVSGSAADAGGGRVAAVEVSTDGGSTWHAAAGTTSWTYAYRQRGSGPQDVRVRAIDDSANIGPSQTREIQVRCPCSVFGGVVPPVEAANDAGDAELGMRLTPTEDGYVSGVRFYKGPGNGGTHVGSMWSSSGERLAQVTFTGETATGWQTARFARPVAVTAGTTYTVSYTAPQGHYSLEMWAFASRGVEDGPLEVAGGFGAEPAGVFAHPGQYPLGSYRRSNYFVDALFTSVDDSPLLVVDQAPPAGASSVPASVAVTAVLTKSITPDSLTVTVKDATGAAVEGTTTYDSATRTVRFVPDGPLGRFVQHTVVIDATDAQGQHVNGGGSWSFTTAKPPNEPGVCPCSLFDDEKVPAVLASNDPGPVTLGVRFSADRAGTVSGIRFYKAVENTGTHTGALWTREGTLLASGTFVDESTAGWQTLLFDEPVEIEAGAAYVASYRAPVGRWSADVNAFDGADLDRAPLHVGRDAGAYTYGTGFPGSTSAFNYHVDVLYDRGPAAIDVVSQDPPGGAVDVPRGASVAVEFSAPVTSAATLAATGPGGEPIDGELSLSADGTRLRLTPSAPLPADSDITAASSSVISIDGAVLPDQEWTFHTRGPDSPSEQTLFSNEVPATAAAAEGAPVELGTVFVPAKDGQVTAIRFYKGEGNGGVHRGSLWTVGGDLLATATFAGETATGWQTAALSAPVHVDAGSRYVVSYLAPQGHYAYTRGFFASPWASGDLSAPSGGNGRYLYGSGGGFPTETANAANYFADLFFEPDPPIIKMTSRDPSPGSTGVTRTTTPRVTFDDAIGPGWSMTVRDGGNDIAGNAVLSADGTSLTFTPDAVLPADTELEVRIDGVVSSQGAELGTATWTFRTEAGAASQVVSLFTGQTPADDAVSDGQPITLGLGFTSSVDGQATGLKFFKGVGNNGPHVGSLWSDDGTLLAQLTFSGETASGWQTAFFDSPVDVSAGGAYVVGYHSPSAVFAITPGFFGAPVAEGPLTASTANGRYAYGPPGTFPSNASGNGNAYWVDVVLRYAPP